VSRPPAPRSRSRPGGRQPVPLAAKVAYLSRPQGYPRVARRVEAIETHMSWVFLTDDRAFKLKKPVRYAFLDFGTLELRRLDCRREVRLNRRLAPGVYLGVVPLCADERGQLRLGDARPGERVVEWLVEMRRLPADRTLEHRIRTGQTDADEVRVIARLLAAFYLAARLAPMTPRRYRDRFRADVADIRTELAGAGEGLPQPQVREIADRLGRFLDSEAELLARRVDEGRIVEAHGDLRPQHVFVTEPPVVIDCLEFRRELRLLDPADELAYLALECERLGAAWIGGVLYETYAEVTGDRPPSRLLRFYAAFRAFLRARIAHAHLAEPRDDRARWLAATRSYLDLASAHLDDPEPDDAEPDDPELDDPAPA
jgi:uncharacterized protein